MQVMTSVPMDADLKRTIERNCNDDESFSAWMRDAAERKLEECADAQLAE